MMSERKQAVTMISCTYVHVNEGMHCKSCECRAASILCWFECLE